MTRLTLAVPYYSGRHYLEEALQSIIAQDCDDWQAVVVDDGGPEPAGDVVRAIGDPRLRYKRFEENLGLAGNWNRCVDLAETEFVTLLHADDRLKPHYVRTMLAAHDQHPADAVDCRAQIIGPDGRPVFSFADWFKHVGRRQASWIVRAGDEGLARLLRRWSLMCPTLCYRRELFERHRFDASWSMVVDVALVVDVLMASGRIVSIPDIAYEYRRHATNQTSVLTADNRRFEEDLAIWDLASERARLAGWPSAERAGRRKLSVFLHLMYRAGEHLLHGDIGAARAKGDLLRRSIHSTVRH